MKMANYLKDANHLILWPVNKEVAENDLFLCHVGIRARGDMTGKELLNACLEAWQLDKEKCYRLVLVRAQEQVDIPLDSNQTIHEIGLRNGDPLEIVAC